MSNWRRTLTAMAVSIFFATGANAVLAADSNSDGETAASGPAESVRLAHELYRYGDEAEDALAVIVAARILGGVEFEAGEAESMAEPAEGTTETASADQPDSMIPDSAEMIERARELAGGNDALGQMIDDVESQRSKGRVPYALKDYESWVAPGYVRTLGPKGMIFAGDRPAEVIMVGDHEANLDLFVYDENGNLICRSTSAISIESCSWRPRWTGPFRLKIVNKGRTPSAFVLSTN